MTPTKRKNSPPNQNKKTTTPDELELIQYITPHTYYKITCISSILDPFLFILSNIAHYDFPSMNGYIPIRIRSSYPELICLAPHPKRARWHLRNISVKIINESTGYTATVPIFENITIYKDHLQLLVRDTTYELINHFVNHMDCTVIQTKKRP